MKIVVKDYGTPREFDIETAVSYACSDLIGDRRGYVESIGDSHEKLTALVGRLLTELANAGALTDEQLLRILEIKYVQSVEIVR